MESVPNASESSPRPENTPTSPQRLNRPSNSAAGSSSRQSEGNRLIDNLANSLGYSDGDSMSSLGVPHRPWITIGRVQDLLTFNTRTTLS